MKIKIFKALVLLLILNFNHLYAIKPISLNGFWDVEMSDNQPELYKHKVKVPGIISMAIPSFQGNLHGNIPPRQVDEKDVWYRTTFELSEENFENAILKIRAKYNAEVFLNGINLGYDHHTTYSHAAFDASKAINFQGLNTLVVKVGSWHTASSPSKETETQFWRNSRCPGIWDNVELCLSNNPAIQHVQVIPDLSQEKVLAKVTMKNSSTAKKRGEVRFEIREKETNKKLSTTVSIPFKLKPGEETQLSVLIPCNGIKHWTAGKEGSPWLNILSTSVHLDDEVTTDTEETVFGYRSFEIKGADIFVNGQKAFFRAGNIAFSRALIRWDYLIFNDKWVRNLLSTLKNDYNYNYIRSHIGHMPSNWYDIADEVGLMIHDEWRYFHDSDPVGKDLEEAEIELTRWVEQNINHPSIVVWDNENEGDVVLAGLMEKLRELDPTRPWGEEDFDADHVYDYSETLTDSIIDQLDPEKPSTVLESCRLWLNEFGWPDPKENFKTVKTATAWGFKYYTSDDILQLQADIHADLGTFYRSRRFEIWSPFVILSSDVNGQNFFMGDIGESLKPKPCLLVLRDLNEPFGVSVDMLQAKEWYRDKKIYSPGKNYIKEVKIWNDFNTTKNGTIKCVLYNSSNNPVSDTSFTVSVPSGAAVGMPLTLKMPKKEDIYYLHCHMVDENGNASKSPVRRFMVAYEFKESMLGVLGFGGRSQPTDGALYFATAYSSIEVPHEVRDAIQNEFGQHAPISDFSVNIGNDSVVFDLRAEYKHYQINMAVDIAGNVIQKVEKRRLKESDIPLVVREGMIRELGFIPIDEAKILKFTIDNDSFYQIESDVTQKSINVKFDSNGHKIR
jgi:hypothetical protein